MAMSERNQQALCQVCVCVCVLEGSGSEKALLYVHVAQLMRPGRYEPKGVLCGG